MSESELKRLCSRGVSITKELDTIGRVLQEEVEVLIEPLLKQKKFKEAKAILHKFFDNSKDDTGSSVFIEFDLTLSRINQKEKL